MNCERCCDRIPDGENYNHRGKTLCEDCYIGAVQPPRSCDVTAVHSAMKHRELSGQSGTEGLTDLQREIYNFIKTKTRTTKTELMSHFKLPEWELDKQMAVLRHCELTKAKKVGTEVYVVLWED